MTTLKAVNAITFDTHAFVKELTASGFSEAQAEAVTSLVRRAREMEVAEAVTKSDLAAVSSDLAVVRAEMATKAELGEVKADILKWMFGAMGFQTVVVIGAIVAFAKLLH